MALPGPAARSLLLATRYIGTNTRSDLKVLYLDRPWGPVGEGFSDLFLGAASFLPLLEYRRILFRCPRNTLYLRTSRGWMHLGMYASVRPHAHRFGIEVLRDMCQLELENVCRFVSNLSAFQKATKWPFLVFRDCCRFHYNGGIPRRMVVIVS